MNYNTGELVFGLASTTLYLGWSYFAWHSPEPNRALMLFFYANANIAMLWPAIVRAIWS